MLDRATRLLAASALLVVFGAVLPLEPVLGAGTAPQAAVPTAQAGSVVITEITAGGPGGAVDGFFELANVSDHTLDLTGWNVFRCDEEGLRARRSDSEVDLRGVVLAPGQRFTVLGPGASWPADGDAALVRELPERGYGLVVLAPDGAVADAIAVYPADPAPMTSECGGAAELPVTTAFALGESWQRVQTASTTDGAWLRAPATPGAPNAFPRAPNHTVRIDELAAAGPGGHGDDFVELRNAGESAVDLAGWRLYRCVATGAVNSESLQHTFATGDRLAAGQRMVVGGPSFTGAADVQIAVSMADLVSGALLVAADGRRVDGVGVSSREDTACQSGRTKQPGVLDYRTGESWQRTPDGVFIVSTRTPGAPNRERDTRLSAREFSSDRGSVAVSEIATDPQIGEMPRQNYVELANFGSASVDLSGWSVIACGADGFRRVDDLAVVADGTVLAPGAAWTAALEGTPAARGADARFREPLELAGAGVWVQDAEGRRVDSVGVFHRNEMDGSIERASICTNGLSLPTFAVDRLRVETLQRVSFTGDDATDFVPEAATPGSVAAIAPVSASALIASARASAQAAVLDEGIVARTVAIDAGRTLETSRGAPIEVTEVHAGTAGAPLTDRRGMGERMVGAGAARSRDEGYGFPYVRLRVRIPDGGETLTWSGRTVGRAEVRLSVWSPATPSPGWRTLDSAAGTVSAASAEAEAPIHLEGRVRRDEAPDGLAEVLVQVVPRADSPFDDAPGLANPSDYDTAIGHITDTQYYSEAYPAVYASEVAWLAANADARKIGFVTHTGDLIQNWVDPDQREDRARREFVVASGMQAVLDAAGVPNSVLPGNHDNKRGVSNDLFNDYFGPERYLSEPWYGAPIAEGDNSASWSSFEAAGARFVMISLPYAYGEREVAWAEGVVEAHPDANVIVSTHEHLTPASPEADAERSTTSRWVSHGDLLWKRVIAPHRNVVIVLSGHFHGLGAVVTEDAGGIAGHTVIEALADYQEFRTPTGERATGFQRLLQLDLAAGMLAVDTFSVALDATASHPYDYAQFVPDDGRDTTASNERPWRIIDHGLQHRYTADDDEFSVPLGLQYAKAVETDAILVR